MVKVKVRVVPVPESGGLRTNILNLIIKTPFVGKFGVGNRTGLFEHLK